MNLKSYNIILTRQVKEKWLRFLLASGGIMIGIWAIALITAVGTGVSTTIVEAINKQPSILRVDIGKAGGNGELNFTEEPNFLAIDEKEFDETIGSRPEVKEYIYEALVDFYIHTDLDTDFNCKEESAKLAPNPQDPSSFENIEEKYEDFSQKCLQSQVNHRPWNEFYLNNESLIIGQTTPPAKDEIAICFKCGNLNLGERMGLEKAEELLGEEITIEFINAPVYGPLDEEVKASDYLDYSKDITETTPKKFRVVTVIDDSEGETPLFNFSTGTDLYLQQEVYNDLLDEVELDFPKERGGYYSAIVFVEDYTKINDFVNYANENGYFAVALLKSITDGLTTAITILSYILAIFGIIALIASVFGIVNVMTISVLERKKEIGILKSLGAKDSDIFWIFFIESIILGFLGWLLGILLTLGSNALISSLFDFIINSNEDWKESLRGLGIEGFSPILESYIIIATLILAVFFTSISGIIPAIRASRQNPVEVLRSE